MTPDVGVVFPHNCHNIPTSTRSRLFVLCSGGPWEAFCKIYHRWVMTNAKIPPPLSRMLLGAPEGAFAHSHLCSLCLSLGDAHPLTQQVFIEHLLEACILVGASILARDAAAAAAKSLRCPTLCNPIDNSPPGSPIPGILQAKTLEWVAISFSNAWKWKVKVKSLSRVWLLATPWTAAYQAPASMGFFRQEYWSGVPLPSPLLCCRLILYQLSYQGSPSVPLKASACQHV